MKRNILSALFAAATASMLFTSCLSSMNGIGTATGSSNPTTAVSSSDNGSQSLLGSLINGLVGTAMPLSQDAIIGTWKYQSPECRFESENALSMAGGEIAANTIENKLADIYTKIGIKKGACSFTFNRDNTCVITIGKRTINGTYTLDTKSRALNIVSTTGLLKLNAHVYYSVSTLTLLFEADKLLTLLQGVSAVTGQLNSTLGLANSLIGSYKGMMLGMNLQK